MTTGRASVIAKLRHYLEQLRKGDDSSIILSNSFRFALAGILAQIFPLLSIPLMMRTLSSQEWGFYTILVQTGSLLQVFGTTLYSQSLLRFYATTEESQRHKLVWTSIAGGTFTQGALLSLLWFFREPTIDATFPNVDIPIDPAFSWAVFWWFFATFRTLLMTIAKVQEKPWQALQLTGLYGAVLLPSLAIVAWADLGFVGALQSLILAELVGSTVNLILITRDFKFSLDKEVLRRGVCFALPLLPSSLMTSLLLNADRIVLSRFASLSWQGHYALGSMIGSGMAIIVTSFWSSYSARVLAVNSIRGIRAAAQTGKDSMRLGVGIVALPLVGLCVLGWPFFSLITASHDQIAISLIASIGVATGHFCRFLTLPAQHSLFMQNRTYAMLAFSACTLVIMSLTSVALAFAVAPIAVAFAFALTHLIVAIPYYRSAHYRVNVDLPHAAIAYGALVIAGAVAAASWYSQF